MTLLKIVFTYTSITKIVTNTGFCHELLDEVWRVGTTINKRKVLTRLPGDHAHK